jgi:hypothetical protein
MNSTAAGLARAPHSPARSPVQDLLHALNQPLTGLQCCLELAAARPRSLEEYELTLREAIELTGRMRHLVEALQAVSEIQTASTEPVTDFLLDELFSTTLDELRPLADQRHVHVNVGEPRPLAVQAPRHRLKTSVFQFLEAALSLAQENSTVQVKAHEQFGFAAIDITWLEGEHPAGLPSSRPELALLIAQAGWEACGGTWTQSLAADVRTCRLQMPTSSARSHDHKCGASS